MKSPVLAGLAVLAGCVSVSPLCAADDESAAIQARLTGYLEAFNDGDAGAVSGFWAEDAVSVNEETGERTIGRDALLEDFKTFFSDSPGARITGDVNHIRLVRPEVAIVEGQVTLFLPDVEPTPSAYTAVMVKEGGKWVLESSSERPLPTPASPTAALEDLGWLVGEWSEESDSVSVSTTFRWSPSNAFLIRSYNAEYADGEVFEGTQVIGWNPREKRFQTWNFNSDGSFGEGVVSRSGDEWLLKTTQVESDGVLSASTLVVKRVDDDTLTVQKIGQSEDGIMLPASDPITLRRAADANAEGAEQ